MYIQPPFNPKFPKIRYYIDYYSVIDYISEYEWNVARHDVHEFLYPQSRTTSSAILPNKVSGD